MDENRPPLLNIDINPRQTCCHGLDGAGSTIGPLIPGMKAKELPTLKRMRPKGMPTHADGALSGESLAAIAAYLNSISK